MTNTLTATSQAITDALTVWHESGRASFERAYPRLDYDAQLAKSAKDGKRWIKLDSGSSGYYLVDKKSDEPMVYTIKAYGVPNRRVGTLAQMTAQWKRQSVQWSAA